MNENHVAAAIRTAKVALNCGGPEGRLRKTMFTISSHSYAPDIAAPQPEALARIFMNTVARSVGHRAISQGVRKEVRE